MEATSLQQHNTPTFHLAVRPQHLTAVALQAIFSGRLQDTCTSKDTLYRLHLMKSTINIPLDPHYSWVHPLNLPPM